MKMKFLSSLPIRKKLLLLVAAAILPALGIILYTGIDNRNSELASAKREIMLLAQSLAAQQDQTVIGIKQILLTLALLPEVKNLDVKACNDIFADILERNPIYSTIGAVTPDGNVFAASAPFISGSINIADRKHFKDAVRTRDFAAGEYSVERVSGIPSITFAYPVINESGKLAAVLVVGFKLDSYQQFISKVDLPKGSVFGIADYKNLMLYRFPQDDNIPYGRLITFPYVKDIKPDSPETFEERMGGDGVYRTYAHKWLWLRHNEPPYLSIYVGLPEATITRRADIALIRNLILLGLAVFLAMAAAWIIGGAIIVKPLNTIADKTRQIGGGRTDVRTHLLYTQDELGQLAKSFDDMVIALDQTNNKRTAAEKEREALIAELSKALANIKTLKGLLPICASCKKIRDDKGYWEQIETYVRDHSEANFSHSICPDCMKKLYPEFYKDVDDDSNK